MESEEMERVHEILKGKSFDQLVEIFDGFAKSAYNAEIESIIMDKMIELDEDRFLDWELQQ